MDSSSTTFTIRMDPTAKERLEQLAKDTGRSRSYLAAEAINDYLDINAWQVAGVKQAIASLDDGEALSQDSVRDWVQSWDDAGELTLPEERPMTA